jgi:hypothetical protein
VENESIEIEIEDLLSWELIGERRFMEMLIKRKGVWKFNKYDKDPFPSLPHGHNQETGEKLNPYNGISYNSITHLPVRKLRFKDLIIIQMKLVEKGFINKENLV